MNETDAWNSFLMSGSVIDYLQYKSIQNAKKSPATLEEKDEIQDKRTDNKRAEHQGTG
ncbi:MAG: hypothetical protein IKB73_05940 [Ruminococcus sp.]|nr:hypothetical protein [Ruminococcus sp.]